MAEPTLENRCETTQGLSGLKEDLVIYTAKPVSVELALEAYSAQRYHGQ